MTLITRGGDPVKHWGAEQTIRHLREEPIQEPPPARARVGDTISFAVQIDDVSVKALAEDRAGVLAAWQERACRRMAAYVESLVIDTEPDRAPDD